MVFACAGSWLLSVAQSRFRKWGLLCSCGTRAAQCGDFSCCEQGSRDPWASVIAAPRVYSVGSVALEHEPSCSAACGIFPDQGSMSPALAGGFLTSEPPGKSCLLHRGLCRDFVFWEIPIWEVRKSHRCQLLASSFCLYGAVQIVKLRISTVHFDLRPSVCSQNEKYFPGHSGGIRTPSVSSKWPNLGTHIVFNL